MHKVLLIFFLLLSVNSFANDDFRCNWIDKVRNSDAVAYQLEIIKKQYSRKRIRKCNIQLVYLSNDKGDILYKSINQYDIFQLINEGNLNAIRYFEPDEIDHSELSKPSFVFDFNCEWLEEMGNTISVVQKFNILKENHLFSNNSYCNVELAYTRDGQFERSLRLAGSHFELIKAEQLDSIYFSYNNEANNYDKKKNKIVLALNCNWMNSLKKSNSTKEQLEILQQNFGLCSLVIADGHPISSGSSTFAVADERLFIETIRPEEVDSILMLEEAAATTLYGTAGSNGLILIRFKNDQIKNLIRARVFEKLRSKAKI